MRIRLIAFVAVCVLAVSAPAGAAQKYVAFRVPQEQFRATVKTLAMMSPLVGKDVPQGAAVMQTYDSLVTAELEAAGFVVIPAMEYDLRWALGIDSLGGFFDPKTGEQDTIKQKTLRRQIHQVMRDQFHADALLRSVFVPTQASFASGTASWDGVEQDLTKGFGGVLSAFGAVGTIPAVTLYLWIEDLDENLLYTDKGGVQVMSKLKGAGKFESVPVESLFTRPDFNARAVHTALRQLVEPEAGKKKKRK